MRARSSSRTERRGPRQPVMSASGGCPLRKQVLTWRCPPVTVGVHRQYCRFSCLTKLRNSVINYQHPVRSKVRHDAAHPPGWVIFLQGWDPCHERFLVAASQQWAMPNDSGVVQQAGHAALDRRIGVRIPAPESAAVGIEAGFVHLLACPGSQWLGGIDLASTNGPIV